MIKYMRRIVGEEWMGGGGDKAANPCRRITARAIDATTATPGGGARGRPCRNADATCRRVGHRATRPTPPVDHLPLLLRDGDS